jgi:hypothetical protein
MRELLFKIFNGVKNNQADIVLAIGVMLISLLSFAMGYIVAKTYEKESLKIEYNSNLQMESKSTNNLFGVFGCNSDGIRIILCV